MTERPGEDEPVRTEADVPQDEGPGLRASIEAILLVVDEPVAEITLAQLLDRPRREVAATLRELAEEYTGQGRGFDLREVAGGWRFYTRDVCAPVVERFVTDGQQARLTQAALETLAVVAYRQPVSRARVSAVRGVNSDGVMRTLTLRGLIEDATRTPSHRRTSTAPPGTSWSGWGCATWTSCPTSPPTCPTTCPTTSSRKSERQRGRTAPEGPGRGRDRQPPALRGTDRRGPGHGERQHHLPVRRAGRSADRRDPRGRPAGRDPLRDALLRDQQAARRGQHHVRRAGPQVPRRLRGRARAAVPRRPPRHRHRGPDPAHQRR